MRRAARLSRAETSSIAIDATLASLLPNRAPSHARFRSTRVREFATLQNSVNRNHHATARNDRLSRTIRLEPQRRSAPLFCKARLRLQTIARTRRCPFLELCAFCHSRIGSASEDLAGLRPSPMSEARAGRRPALGSPRARSAEHEDLDRPASNIARGSQT